MAKLKARGRQEIWKVVKESNTPASDLTTWEKHEVALMSEGSILERRVVRFKPDRYEPKGRLHDYGWKVKGKLKGTLTAAQGLEIYQKKGYSLVGEPKLDAFSANYAKALEASKNRSKKAAEKRVVEKATKHGPGFYVTNAKANASAFSFKHRVAELGPYQNLDTAIEKAAERLRNFLSMKFTYLLPVQVVEAPGRSEAEEGKGHVWWQDGKSKGPPVSKNQLSLFG